MTDAPEELAPATAEAAPVEEAFTLPEDFADQVKSWDIDVEAIPEAVKHWKSLQTDDGVIDAFVSYGAKLGFGVRELESLYAEPTPAPAPAAPAEPEDPDRLLSHAEVQAMIEQERTAREAAFQERETRDQQARQASVMGQINGWFESQGVKDIVVQRQIAAMGEKHLDPKADTYDPRVSIAALERGKADYEAWLEREVQSYAAEKHKTAQVQPTPLGAGHAEGGQGEEKLDYAALGSGALDAARARVRARMRESGELG